jgi:hypothetical protein
MRQYSEYEVDTLIEDLTGAAREAIEQAVAEAAQSGGCIGLAQRDGRYYGTPILVTVHCFIIAGGCGSMRVCGYVFHQGDCRLSALAVGRLLAINVSFRGFGEAVSLTKPWG